MLIFKKIFRHYGASRDQMAFTTKYPNFLFFVFHHFLVTFADTILTEPMPQSLQCHRESVWLKKVMRPKIKILWSSSALTPIMLAFRQCT